MKSFLSLVLALGFFSFSVSTAQYVELLSDEAIQVAAAAATDSLGSPAVLIGLSAPGPIDLTELGIPVESDGLDLESGRSTVWGYLFRNEDSTDQIGIILLKDASGAATIIASRDIADDIDTKAQPLILDEEYSRSDAMVDRLGTDLDFIAFGSEYPAFVLNQALLLTLSERPPKMPLTFPIDTPVWGIELTSEESDGEEMFCFIASGSGETVCLRESSGVENRSEGAGTLSATPNIALSGERIRVTLMVPHDSMPDRIGLLDVTGAEVLDLSSQLGAMGAGATTELIVPTSALPSGTYYLYALVDGGMTSTPIVIAR